MAEPENSGLTHRRTGNNTANAESSPTNECSATAGPSGSNTNKPPPPPASTAGTNDNSSAAAGFSGSCPGPSRASGSQSTTACPSRGNWSQGSSAGPSGTNWSQGPSAGPSGMNFGPGPTASASGGPSSSSAFGWTGLTPPPTVEYEGYKGNMSEYCAQLENWLWRSYWHREIAMSAYYTALSAMFPVNRGYGPPGTVPPTGFQYAAQAQDPAAAAAAGYFYQQRPAGMNNNNNAGAWNLNIPRQGGHANPIVRRFVVRGIRTNNNSFAIDFNIAPIWKRFLAECIDFVILLVVKLFVTLTIIDNFDLIDLDNIDLDAVHESKNLVDMALALSWELVILEFTHRIVVCFFEAYCLAKGGATPGKSLMNLRVLHCEQVIPLANTQNNLNPLVGGGLSPDSRVLVSPGSFLNFPRALLRSTIKNFSLAFFFPLCFTLFHFEHNRTLYDLSSKSIVVEIRPQQ